MALITTQTIKGPFDAITAGQATLALTVGNVGGDTFTVTGREILLVQNSHATTAYTITISSVADERGRTGDITAYSLAAGEIAMFGIALTNSPGWKNTSTQLIAITPNNAAIKWAVLKLPAGYPG